MSSDVTPDQVRRASFKSSIRGLDRSEVESFLDQVAEHVEALEADRERLRAQLADTGSKDLVSEFERVGQEVNTILQAARDAAESMRERASIDAARWRSEAMADADGERRAAAADSEALRRDAWTAGTDLLQQTGAEAEKMRLRAERDVLTTMGEAEREAHRLTSAARREAEDLVRASAMNAEKTVSDANKRRDDIIDQANRQAAAAQERTRALEQRRDELLRELENVRATLTRLEGSLEEKRETMDLSKEYTSVKVVPAPVDEPKVWELGETVRVVKAEARPGPEPLTDLDVEALTGPPADEEAAPMPEAGASAAEEPEASLAAVVPPAEEPEVQAVPETAEASEPDPEPPAAPEPTTGAAPVPPGSELDALFASLRTDDGSVVRDEAPDQPELDQPTTETVEAVEGVDWIEERDQRLLPITNRALRGVKKAITELQNIALDSLRTDDDWSPDAASITEAVHAELTMVWSESFAAGHAVAEDMTGERLERPKTPKSTIDKDFGRVLAAEVAGAVEDAGDEQRARQSAVAKVYRIWRTDEAERRVREAAIDAFERGIEKSIPTEAPVG